MAVKKEAADSGYSARTILHGTRVTIVGIGNEFRGDDAVGLKVVRSLESSRPAGVRTMELTGDQSNLLELMRSTNAMIIVDAVQSSAPAGTIFRIEAGKERVPENFLFFSTHSFNSLSAIETARTLGLLPRCLLLYGIVGKDFSHKIGLAEEVEDAIDVIREKIIEDVESVRAHQSVCK